MVDGGYGLYGLVFFEISHGFLMVWMSWGIYFIDGFDILCSDFMDDVGTIGFISFFLLEKT